MQWHTYQCLYLCPVSHIWHSPEACLLERYICVGFFSVFFTFFPSSRVLQYDQRLKIRIIESLFSNFKKYLPQRKDNLSSCLKKTTLTLHRINTDNLYALLTAYMFITVLFFYRYDMSYKIIPILYKMMYIAKSVCKHHSIVGCA